VSQFDASGVAQAKDSLRGLSRSANVGGTAVAGSGFAASTAGRAMRGGASGAAALSAAMGSGNSGVAATARGASAALAGFAAGGVWGLLIAAITAGVAAWMNYREKVKKALEESTAAFKRHLSEIVTDRLERTVEIYKKQADAIKETARASQQLSDAYERQSKSEAAATAMALEGEKATKLSTETDPARRKQIELDYAQRIAMVELTAAKEAAQYAENEARSRLAAARQLAALAGGKVGALSAQLGQSTEKARPEIQKKLDEAKIAQIAAINDVRAAEAGLSAATVEVANSRTRIELSESNYAIKLDEIARGLDVRKAQGFELSAVEGELESATLDLANAMDAEKKALASAGRAGGRAEDAEKGTLKKFVGRQTEKYKAQQEEMREEQKFKKEIADLKERRKSGRVLSAEDRWKLDFAEQRGRAVEANMEKQRKEIEAAKDAGKMAADMAQAVSELQEIRTNLQKALEVQ
jgi:hypothetical protein